MTFAIAEHPEMQVYTGQDMIDGAALKSPVAISFI